MGICGPRIVAGHLQEQEAPRGGNGIFADEPRPVDAHGLLVDKYSVSGMDVSKCVQCMITILIVLLHTDPLVSQTGSIRWKVMLDKTR